jgi:hypothetical protein
MARIREWLPKFLKRHRGRFGPHDWPVDDTEEYREYSMLWITQFATREVTEAEADEASRSLGATPPNFRREHLPAVVGAIEAIRRQRGVQPGAGTREVIRDESRNCPHCGGEGLATAWAAKPDVARKIPETVAAYCCCPSGRWVKRTHADKSPEMLRRIPDFGEVLDGVKPNWLAHPPGRRELSPPEEDEAPFEEADPARAVARAEIAEMFRVPK